jgi:hypothetical protein
MRQVEIYFDIAVITVSRSVYTINISNEQLINFADDFAATLLFGVAWLLGTVILAVFNVGTPFVLGCTSAHVRVRTIK